MWCANPKCHRGFKWSTGKEIKGNFHNPERIRYIQEHGSIRRETNDITCGGIPNYFEIKWVEKVNRKLQMMLPHFQDIKEVILDLCMFITNILELYYAAQRFERTLLPKLREKYQPPNSHKRHLLRVRFLAKEITEKSFKSNITRRIKKNINSSVLDIYEMFYSVLVERIKVMCTDNDLVTASDIMKEIEILRKFTNQNIHNYNIKFSTPSKPLAKIISPELRLVPDIIQKKKKTTPQNNTTIQQQVPMLNRTANNLTSPVVVI